MDVNSVKAAAACIFFGGGIFYHAIKKHRQARKVEDTPTSKAGTAPMGTVELEGFAWHAQEKFKTTSGMEAVYYSLEIQQKVTTGSGKNRKTKWVTVYAITQGQLFYLVDPTGLAEVHVHDAEFNLESARTRNWRSLSKLEQAKIRSDLIDKDIPNFPPSDFLFGLLGKPTRIIENEILVGSPLYALGNFGATENFPKKVSATGLSQFASRVFDSQKRGFRKLTGLLDKNGDGQADATEAKHGYAMLAKVSINKAVNESHAETEFQIHGYLNSSEAQKLLVADAHQAQLVERVSQYLWPKFFAGAALTAFGIVMLLNPNLDFLTKKNMRNPATQAPKEKLPVVSTAPPESDAIRLHQECVAGLAPACSQLIARKNEFQLNEVNLSYYRKQQCKVEPRLCL